MTNDTSTDSSHPISASDLENLFKGFEQRLDQKFEALDKRIKVMSNDISKLQEEVRDLRAGTERATKYSEAIVYQHDQLVKNLNEFPLNTHRPVSEIGQIPPTNPGTAMKEWYHDRKEAPTYL